MTVARTLPQGLLDLVAEQRDGRFVLRCRVTPSARAQDRLCGVLTTLAGRPAELACEVDPTLDVLAVLTGTCGEALELVGEDFRSIADARSGSSGSVESAGDGVAVVRDMGAVGSQEAVEFESGALGIALTLHEDRVGVVLVSEPERVREGEGVRRAGHPMRIPVGDALLGRVIDPLGNPLDDLGPVEGDRLAPVERKAPSIVERAPVDTPLHTGLLAVDALVPIGRGQRELVLGDRRLGKTTIAIDALLAQVDGDVACVYCAIGQRAAALREVVDLLACAGALSRTCVVASFPDDLPGLRYLTPLAACAVAEYFMDCGRDALVIYDDLSKHAVTYREISALLGRPVGREAYPGDIFYLHSRLLERGAKRAPIAGGGSITALPIVETLAGDLSAYIPTNLISICDGQIVLDAAAANEGRRPAIDAGLSVSRVGGAAQPDAVRRLAGRARVDLAQYQELERFVKFGAEVDETTQRQLARGARLQWLMAQAAHAPLPLAAEVAVLLAADEGHFDAVPERDLRACRDALVKASVQNPPAALTTVASTGVLGATERAEIVAFLGAWFEVWGTASTQATVAAAAARDVSAPAFEDAAAPLEENAT